MTPMTPDVPAICAGLTKAQREELLHYENGEGFMPPGDARRAHRLWLGVRALRQPDPTLLLAKARGQCLYRPTPIGTAVIAHLLKEQQP